MEPPVDEDLLDTYSDLIQARAEDNSELKENEENFENLKNGQKKLKLFHI